MNFQNHYKILNIYLFLISIFTILLFFFGFYLQENSAGAGGFNGDFNHVWNNLSLFKNNTFSVGLDATAGTNEYKYKSSRPPLIYILNSYFNPFVENKESYITSIFFFSFFTYALFYYSLKKNYENQVNNSHIFFLSSIILLSPYFRTSSYWGLEENFGIFASLVSIIFFKKILIQDQENKKINLFFLTFFSSLCVYFDQKLVIIPLYFYLNLVFSKKNSFNEKINITFFYLIFSIPFLYLVYIWKNIMPTNDAGVRDVLQKIFLEHLVFSLSIIAFYMFPFLFLKKENIFLSFMKKFKNYKIYTLFAILVVYLLLLAQFNPIEKEFLGNGIVYKFSIVVFSDFELSKIFLYLSFFVSAAIIHLFIEDSRDYLFVAILILISIFITPLYQEYYDPLILILILLFFYTKISLNFSKLTFLYSYFFIFLIIANVYYKSSLFLFFK